MHNLFSSMFPSDFPLILNFWTRVAFLATAFPTLCPTPWKGKTRAGKGCLKYCGPNVEQRWQSGQGRGPALLAWHGSSTQNTRDSSGSSWSSSKVSQPSLTQIMWALLSPWDTSVAVNYPPVSVFILMSRNKASQAAVFSVSTIFCSASFTFSSASCTAASFSLTKPPSSRLHCAR